MTRLRRFARLAALVLPLAFLAAPPAPAAPPRQEAASTEAWLYRGSDVPQDREWQFGTLANGVRYAVRRNGVPPGQVSIRILMEVGSLYETDEERGFAHLLEHLVFRQSKYLGEAQAIPTWQRLGASFGSDTNAETSPTQTVYKLDLPDATPAKLDESFRLLSGMMIEPTLSEANVRAEVPIVLAEMRERGGVEARLQKAMRQTFYAGQRLAEREPIGTAETLNAATQDRVRAFHRRWYRPERAVIVVAGDADPAQLAALVGKHFAAWRGIGEPAEPPAFGDPAAPDGASGDAPVGETAVIVEPDMPWTLSWAVLRPWRQVNDTIVYNQGLMTDALAQQIINRRLEARARAGGSFLLAQVNQEDVARSADGTFISVTPPGDDWQTALADVRAVIADAIETPPTQDEIDREVAEMDVAFQVPVEQRSLLPGSKVADDLVNAVDIRETVASPEVVLDIFRQTIPLFTPDAVHQRTRALFSGTVTRAVLVTPQAGAADAETVRRALLAPVSADGSARLASAPIRFDDLPPIGKPGEIASLAPTGLLGIEQVDFANGVKALIWPVRDEPGRVAVKVRFGGGYRVFNPRDAAYIRLGEMALVGSGAGKLGQEELDRIATGRKLGFRFRIDEGAFEFSADTRAADLADQLYLFASKLAMPRWDPNPVLRAKAASRIQYEAYGASPQGVLERDFRFLQRDRDPRYATPTPAEIEKATPEGFRKVWEAALATGPVEVQVFGDVDRNATVAALQATFGALAERKPLPASAPTRGRVPAPAAQPVTLTHRGDANQAAAVISWPTGGGSAGIPESRQLEILTQLFANRLLDALRERTGASYAPQVVSSWPVDLESGGSITALAQVQPEAVPAFFAAAQEIAADLIARPAGEDELARVIEPLRQQITRAATGSAFFMYQLEGATGDPARIASVRTLLGDFTQTTPEKMQELAARYLSPDKGWRLAILPAAQDSAVAATR
ncbi:MAG TPA: insulinase family protein [Novosphingobium sp.]|nr:insulinase family protein [Novosphingobium sp.]